MEISRWRSVVLELGNNRALAVQIRTVAHQAVDQVEELSLPRIAAGDTRTWYSSIEA